MAEINDGNGIKLIPFYLPQFHTIPENDEWWGKGFTEWSNVRTAKPLFDGHNQPKVPLNKNYYDLKDDQIKIQQAEMAKEYGIYGFCYYHYWFKHGKKLLEKPAEQMLANKNIDLPFCFSWANENWSKNWDGGNHEIIMKQEYGGKTEWEDHLRYLLPFFRDKRYMTFNGKPLFIIYKPEQIIDIYQMTKYWKARMKEEGFPGLYLGFQYPSYYADMYFRQDVFDFRIAFEPVFSRDKKVHDKPGTDKRVKIIRRFMGEQALSKYRRLKQNNLGSCWKRSMNLTHLSYKDTWNDILQCEWTTELMPGAFVDWDNTPRNKNGVVYDGFSIDTFEYFFSKLLVRSIKEQKQMLFINAWNEWAEGAFLEPDEEFKFQKLEVIRNALEQCNRDRNNDYSL